MRERYELRITGGSEKRCSQGHFGAIRVQLIDHDLPLGIREITSWTQCPYCDSEAPLTMGAAIAKLARSRRPTLQEVALDVALSLASRAGVLVAVLD